MFTQSVRPVMQVMSLILTFLFPCFVIAGTFPTVESYIAQQVGEHEVLQAQTAKVKTSSGERIFGIVCWDGDSKPEDLATTKTKASVYVLEGANGNFKEVARSQPFEFNAIRRRFLELAIEASSKDKFLVKVLLQSRGIGFFTYRFIERANIWLLAGLDSSQASIHMEEGDIGVGDSREERSTNFLTGRTITKTFHADRLASVERKKMDFPKFPLEQFELFDPKHSE